MDLPKIIETRDLQTQEICYTVCKAPPVEALENPDAVCTVIAVAFRRAGDFDEISDARKKVTESEQTMNYMKITSSLNAKIKAAYEIKQRKSSSEHSFFLIEGPHLIEMALGSDIPIREVFFTESFSRKKEGRRVLEQLSRHTGKLYEVSDSAYHKLTGTETPQGIIAVATHRKLSLKELPLSSNPLLVVSDSIQDPGNLGTIIRTADAVGADAVIILPGTCDVYMQKTVRATAGSLFNIPIVHATVDEFSDWLRAHKILLAVSTVDSEKSFFEADLIGPVAIVFGNEAHGVHKEFMIAADMALNIPIYGKAESLNVATSAAVCLYEAVRQRRR
ncbi:MAG: aviRb [Nitrospirae bacterium]|nr:aviRb [Nitrospirota bacterium]MBS1127102.1 aviRb [Nitrospirota bacterium]MBS1235014.1 aviRb [Nitrospirota bacterium]